MKPPFISVMSLSCAVLALASGCTDPSSEARKAIESNGIGYSVESFFSAIAEGRSDLVRQFIEAGVDLKARKDGATPLMLVASRGETELVRAMVEHGAEINAEDSDGYTPQMYAVEHHAPLELLAYLKAQGARVNSTATNRNYIIGNTSVTPSGDKLAVAVDIASKASFYPPYPTLKVDLTGSRDEIISSVTVVPNEYKVQGLPSNSWPINTPATIRFEIARKPDAVGFRVTSMFTDGNIQR